MAGGRDWDEPTAIAALRALASDPAARGLIDDVAVLDAAALTGDLILTHDTMVAGVHWLPDADPCDVAWKLVASNLSDLAAKGAEPIGVLLSLVLADDADWTARFVAGLGAACGAMDAPLLGGDTVRLPHAGARVLGMTALGRATHRPVPSRAGAWPGDALWVTGTIGDAGAGLDALRRGAAVDPGLSAAHRRPVPRMAEGRALAPLVSAMMDLSDGLLIDAERMAAASGCALRIDLDAVPLSAAFRAARGEDRDARIFAASAGDDYELLCALPADVVPPVPATRVGAFRAGAGLDLIDRAGQVPLPARRGWTH